MFIERLFYKRSRIVFEKIEQHFEAKHHPLFQYEFILFVLDKIPTLRRTKWLLSLHV